MKGATLEEKLSENGVRIRAWASLYLHGAPEDLALAARNRAALFGAANEAIATGDTSISWAETGADGDGHMDAYAYGEAADMAPLLRRLGEQGLCYGVDVDVPREDEADEERAQAEIDADFERAVESCGSGVAFAEAYSVP